MKPIEEMRIGEFCPERNKYLKRRWRYRGKLCASWIETKQEIETHLEQQKQKRSARFAKWRAAKPEYQKERWRRYYAENKCALSEKQKQRRMADVLAAKERERVHRMRRRKAAQAYENKRYRTDPQFRLAKLMRCALWRMAKFGWTRNSRTGEYIGCTFDQLRQHIEAQWLEGMSWDNHGQWEIDHIRPLCSFDLTNPDQRRLAAHYTNLRPLAKAENRRLGVIARWSKRNAA